MPHRERSSTNHRPRHVERLEPEGEVRLRRYRAEAVGAKAIGALALGAFAIGALTIGALAIGRLAIGRTRVRRMEIDELVVRRLRVTEAVRGPDASPVLSATADDSAPSR
jgi:hypothetical protein